MPRRPVIPPKLPTSTRQAKLCWTPLRTGRQPRVHNNSLWPGHHVPTGGYLQNVASETSVLHQLTLSACRCRCRRAPDSLGDHGSACAQARLCAQKKCCRSLPRSVAASGKMTEKSRAMDSRGPKSFCQVCSFIASQAATDRNPALTSDVLAEGLVPRPAASRVHARS